QSIKCATPHQRFLTSARSSHEKAILVLHLINLCECYNLPLCLLSNYGPILYTSYYNDAEKEGPGRRLTFWVNICWYGGIIRSAALQIAMGGAVGPAAQTIHA